AGYLRIKIRNYRGLAADVGSARRRNSSLGKETTPPMHAGSSSTLADPLLPPAPADLPGAVKAWSQPVVIPTYRPMPADKNPMFLEKRVYQGSSGRVYPLPFTDRI